MTLNWLANIVNKAMDEQRLFAQRCKDKWYTHFTGKSKTFKKNKRRGM